MLVGILSDTHGRLPESVYESLGGVDYIIHAGDIGRPSVLWELESIAPTVACLGNNDYAEYGNSVTYEVHTMIGGARIAVTHFPEDAVILARSGQYDLVVHGHTHIPRDILVGKCRVVNPGSTSRPRGESQKQCVTVRIENGVVGPVSTYLL